MQKSNVGDYCTLVIGKRNLTSQDLESSGWINKLTKIGTSGKPKILNLRGNDIDYIPTYIRQLPTIKEIVTDGDDHILDLSGYNITSQELENKDWKNKVITITKEKKQITIINLRHNKLTYIPTYISSLPNIKELWVEDNNITIKIQPGDNKRGFVESLNQNSEVLEKISVLFDNHQQRSTDAITESITEIEEPSILFTNSDEISFTKTKLKNTNLLVAKLKKKNCWGEYKNYILIGSTLLSVAGPVIVYVLKFFLCG